MVRAFVKTSRRILLHLRSVAYFLLRKNVPVNHRRTRTGTSLMCPCTRMNRTMCGRYSLACIDNLCGRFRVDRPLHRFPVPFQHRTGQHEPGDRGARAGGSGHDAVGARAALGKKHHDHTPPDQRPGGKPRGEADVPGPAQIPALHRARERFLRMETGVGSQNSVLHPCKRRPGLWLRRALRCMAEPGGTTLRTYAIITTASNDLMAPIDNRMPVISGRTTRSRWLSRDVLPAEDLHRILAPYPRKGWRRTRYRSG